MFHFQFPLYAQNYHSCVVWRVDVSLKQTRQVGDSAENLNYNSYKHLGKADAKLRGREDERNGGGKKRQVKSNTAKSRCCDRGMNGQISADVEMERWAGFHGWMSSQLRVFIREQDLRLAGFFSLTLCSQTEACVRCRLIHKVQNHASWQEWREASSRG